MKKVSLVLLTFLILNCSTSDDSPNNPTPPEANNEELTKAEIDLLSQYQHMAFQADTEWPAPEVTQKWKGQVNLFINGALTDEFRSESELVLNKLNSFLTDGTSFALTDNSEEAQVQIFSGTRQEAEQLWPDMAVVMDGKSYSGFYLYEWDSNFNIFAGRIWVSNLGMPLLKHELGHILGLGHADATGCGSGQRSIMCSGLANDFSDADEAIIRLLYHPSVSSGKTYEELREILEELILSGEVEL